MADFEILCREDVRRAIDENIARDPVSIALDKRIEHASLVATQVKRLQRAKSKLPSYYAVRAILPPRAYEQSSSELCAAENTLTGDSVLDLTCGLGVDTFALSRKFKRVVSCERDEVLASITRYNLALLGVENVTVENCSAEEYLASTADHFDWIFVDPDRRGEKGEKLVLLEECSPNVVALFPRIMEVAERLCIKSSPLFDTAEAERKFGECSVEVLSLAGECKQVNIYVDGKAPTLSAAAVGMGRFEVERRAAEVATFADMPIELTDYQYLIIPEVA
ncbi:MAG: RsmD family RNA methyltransferase, partial [Alistipes sp.]|nr:RsmD family RNA methyltransferase [Alistipes sp.]